jgi:SAM-dependent methyltransferase
VISPTLFAVVRCPDCGGRITPAGDTATCNGCSRSFDATRGYLDLQPSAVYAEQTKYLDEALHIDARHESVAPPLLGSKIRNDRLRAFLDLHPGDRVIDLGCGSGRAMIWNRDTGAAMTGIDISPYFSREALDDADLLLGDLRKLPLQDAAFSKAWSLDVLEHLSRPALVEMLREANRILEPGGALFVYTHVRKNGPAAVGVRLVNRLAHGLERLGLLDLRTERLRKSDHLNPIADHDDLHRVAAECGFTIDRITYYTPIFGALVENILMRMGERVVTRRAGRHTPSGDRGDAMRSARKSAKANLRARGLFYWTLRAFSGLMYLDVALFGRFRSGPFFARLRKTPEGPVVP